MPHVNAAIARGGCWSKNWVIGAAIVGEVPCFSSTVGLHYMDSEIVRFNRGQEYRDSEKQEQNIPFTWGSRIYFS
jgi:hypothetical protein